MCVFYRTIVPTVCWISARGTSVAHIGMSCSLCEESWPNEFPNVQYDDDDNNIMGLLLLFAH